MINIEYSWRDRKTNEIVRGVITCLHYRELLEAELRMHLEMWKAGYTLEQKKEVMLSQTKGTK